MEALIELDSICRLLESDKVTERKVVWRSFYINLLKLPIVTDCHL